MTRITEQECGFCGADLRGAVIPQESILAGYYGNSQDPEAPNYRDPEVTHYFSRLIGVEYGYDHPARYDGVSEYRCPDCHVRVGRWSGRVLLGNDYERRFGQ